MKKFELTPELLSQARWFENFRQKCKEYLKRAGYIYDKFTVVSHDSFVGFISEVYIKFIISENYSNKGFNVRSWDEQFDLLELENIIDTNDLSESAISKIKDYFYDPYDIEITNGDYCVYIDVKTALTKKEPSETWDFMYPMVQAKKKGKDFMVLTYFVTEDGTAHGKFKKIHLIGFIGEEQIKKCNIVWKGMYTKFHTRSQINNYETNLCRDYQKLDILFENYKKFFKKKEV